MTMMLPCQHFQPNILYLQNKHAVIQNKVVRLFMQMKGKKREDEAEGRNTLPLREGILHFSIFQSSIFIHNVMFSFSLSRERLEW